MRTPIAVFALLGLLMIASTAMADPIIFFEEQFTGPTLDPAAWRTEILTSGPRFCHDTSGPFAPGHWIDEGVECHGIAAYSPYGSAVLSGGLLALSSSNVRAFPILLSRFPGSVPVFPPSGDFTLKLRMRYDRVTPWGVGIVVVQKDSTEPIGDNYVFGPAEDILLQMWCDNPGGTDQCLHGHRRLVPVGRGCATRDRVPRIRTRLRRDLVHDQRRRRGRLRSGQQRHEADRRVHGQ
jgi:hypothetical protein